MRLIRNSDGKRAPNVYKEKFLLNDLYKAATSCRPEDFARFHLNSLKGRIGCEFITINVLDTNAMDRPEGQMESVVAGVDTACIKNYANHLQHDYFTPKLFRYPGTAGFADAQRPMDEWFEQNIYKLHCNLFSFYWIAGLTYRCAYRRRARIGINYINPKEKPFSSPLTLSEFDIEYLSFPFFLGWLYQFRDIDADELNYRLSYLIDLPPGQFLAIRSLMWQPLMNSQKISDALGLSLKAFHRRLECVIERLQSSRYNHFRPPLPDLDGVPKERVLIDAFGIMSCGAGAPEGGIPLRRI